MESWLSSNPEANVSEYEAKLKEVENIYNPLMQRIYQGGDQNGSNNCRGNEQKSYAGPQADEVD